MSDSPRPLPSLLAVTVRRGLYAGRLYLVLGTFLVLLLSILLLRAKHGVFATTYPLEIPVFAGLGSMGGIMLFSSDRSKGVLEYLIAYGVRPRDLFANFVVTAIALATLVLVAALAVGLGA